MGLILAPIAADKVATWMAFMEDLNGPKKAAFDDFNRRYNLTRHDAWLCETPGGVVVCAIHEGPGASDFIANAGKATQEFDKWFAAQLADIHGMDLTKGPPPGKMPELRLSWKA